MAAYLRFIERFAKPILALLALVTVYFALALGKLTNDSNPYLLSESHPARRTILDMQKEFTGTYDAVLIALHNRDGVFNPVTLQAVYDLTEASRRIMLANDADAAYLEALATRYAGLGPELEATARSILQSGFEPNDYFAASKLEELTRQLDLSAADRAFLAFLPRRLNPIKELAGMAASENILMRDGELFVRPTLRPGPIAPEVARDEIMRNELMINGVVSRDEKVALVTVELFVNQEDAEGQLRAQQAFSTIVSDYRRMHPGLTDDVYVAGVPIFIAEQKRLVDRDMATLFPIVVLIVAAILIVFFRRVLGVALPLLNVLMCTIWTLGLMAIFRAPLDLVTSVLPVFLVTICGADAIHIMNEYYGQRASGLSSKAAMQQTMRVMTSPVILTTTTTVAGFLFATSTNISSIRTFGIFMSVGLVVAQIISLLLIPAWLSLIDARAPERARSSHFGDVLGRGLERVFRPLMRNRRPVLLVFALLTGAAGYLATEINVEDAGADYFAQGNAFRAADEFLNEHVAGTSPGWISVEGDGAGSMLKLNSVAFIDRLDQYLASQAYVTYGYSLAKYVKRMNLVMNDMNPEFNRLPAPVERVRSSDTATDASAVEDVSGDDIVAQSVLMYENGGGSDLTNVVNSDFSKAVTMFTMNTTRASEYKRLLHDLDGWLERNTPPGLRVIVGGTPVIWSGVLDEIIKGQLTSFVLALGAVAIVLAVWLRSIKLAVLTSLPLLATAVFYYGVMSLAGIDLNIGTALISFLVVGIVDYSVHFLHRIREGIAAGDKLDDATLRAIRYSGSSIVFNVLLFSVGFLALVASEFTPIVHLGLLVALALTVSGFMSLFLISMLGPMFIAERPPTVLADRVPA